MLSVIIFSILLIIALVQSWIFSLPIRIPFIKRLAVKHRTFRWTAIILLSVIPTMLNAVGLVWFDNSSEISEAATDANVCNVVSEVYCNSEEAGFESVFNLDYALRDELVRELIVRDLVAGLNCVSDNGAVCAAADYWYAHEAAEADAEGDLYFTMLDGLWVWLFLTVLLSPSFMTAFDIYHLTRRNPRKSKYVA